MPSFDVVSEVDKHVLTNAVDQAHRLITNRYDFKGVDANFERKEYEVTMIADAEFQLEQMLDVLKGSLHKNGIDIACLEVRDVKTSGKQVKQEILVRTGLESELSKKIVRLIKDGKLKVQAQIQGDQVRITGKKRDDLQEGIALLRASDIELPLQFTNFRD
ncbi:YajQ family cyclic di-GMP-binding protein [Cellvibrio polysaccharolyticus]|uniref:Nucleotide-binding protein C4F51_14395 n=1 Tax=Cellvibrio polysaccharolyticus TaxID=2082724 RepID=A0A928V811_9GAMM|nr:YajQ family cyclic di-GMP-binding protein [Cellvibrio polysaccharolyticus]MBE8718382.1 YajQ family cyclic di-GMP-binding protein [Cellvibrio polysaccharolyticus]